MNQPWVGTCPLPVKPPSHLPPHPTPLGVTEHQVWAPCVIRQISTGHLLYTWSRVCLHAALSMCPTLSFPHCVHNYCPSFSHRPPLGHSLSPERDFLAAIPTRTFCFESEKGGSEKASFCIRCISNVFFYYFFFVCNKVLLKHKRDRKSFWHRLQKRAERVPPCKSLARCYIATSRLLIREKEFSKLKD